MTKNFLLASTLAMLCIPIAAQRRGIVISADTKLPIRDVAIRWDNREVVKSAWDGTFVIPQDFKRVNFSHPKCETRFLKHEELTDTIYMLPDYVGLTATDRQLAAAQYAGGANLLGVLQLIAQPIIKKIHRNKELKKAKKEQIMNNY